MLGALAPLPPRRDETLRDHMERLARIRVLEAELGKLERQFNRKVEINAKIREVRKLIINNV